MDKTENLLKDLTEAHGIPGYEAEVRKVIRDYFKPLGDIEEDNMGSLICKKAGKDASPKIMLAGHMDEVGFMVKHIYNTRGLVGPGFTKPAGCNKDQKRRRNRRYRRKAPSSSFSG